MATEVLGMRADQQAKVIEQSVKQQDALSTRATLRMAYCFTHLAARGRLECLEKSTLLTSFQIFRSQARNNKDLAKILILCKVLPVLFLLARFFQPIFKCPHIKE